MPSQQLPSNMYVEIALASRAFFLFSFFYRLELVLVLLNGWAALIIIHMHNYVHREIQAQEALQNGQLGSGEGIPDLQPGVLASQAMIEKTLNEDPRWQGYTNPSHTNARPVYEK